jgi:restriction endonuclease Mrr
VSGRDQIRQETPFSSASASSSDRSEKTDYGLTCVRGETFQTPDAYTEHITVEQVLEAVKDIDGEKFHRILKEVEQNGHAGNLRDSAEQQTITYTPDNARKLAKEVLAHYIRQYDDYMLGDRTGAGFKLSAVGC